MERSQGYQRDIAVVIANAGTVSNRVLYRGYDKGGFQIPAAFTGVAMTFQASNDGETFTPLFNLSNTLISITVAVNRAYPLPSELAGFGYFKFVSGTAEGAERSIAVSLKS